MWQCCVAAKHVCSWACVSAGESVLKFQGDRIIVLFHCLYERDFEVWVAVGRQLPAWPFPGRSLPQGLVVFPARLRLLLCQGLVKESLYTSFVFVLQIFFNVS